MDGDVSKAPADGQTVHKPEAVIKPQAAEPSAPNMTPRAEVSQPETSPKASADTTPAQSSQTFPAALPAENREPLTANNIPEEITWTASEFVAHERTTGWYALLVLGAVAATAVVWLFTRDLLPTSAVFIGMVLLTYYASHQPRQQSYRLDGSGLTIGDRHLPYHEFRSFSMVPEGAFLSIELTPLKRFAMYTTIYIDPVDEDRILSFLSAYLPVEEARVSVTDNLMRRIHF